MKKILNFIKNIGVSKKYDTDKKKDVREAAEYTLKEYSKTFRDLARYDRGEKVFNQISR